MVDAERFRLASTEKNLDTGSRLKRGSVNVKGRNVFSTRYGNGYRHEPKCSSFTTWESINEDAFYSGTRPIVSNYFVSEKKEKTNVW